MANKNGLAVPTFLKQWRLHRKLTQEKLGEAIGRSASSISQIENGKHGFTDETLARLAGALRCTPAELLAYDPTREDSFWPLMQALERVAPADRKKIRTVLEALLAKPGE